MAAYRYRRPVLDELLRHGIRPTPATPPAVVKSLLNDLYRFEIRRLRDRLLAGEFPKASYAGRVTELRQRYPLLSVNVRAWTEDAG